MINITFQHTPAALGMSHTNSWTKKIQHNRLSVITLKACRMVAVSPTVIHSCNADVKQQHLITHMTYGCHPPIDRHSTTPYHSCDLGYCYLQVSLNPSSSCLPPSVMTPYWLPVVFHASTRSLCHSQGLLLAIASNASTIQQVGTTTSMIALL